MNCITECVLCGKPLEEELPNKFYYCPDCQVATRAELNMCPRNPMWFSKEYVNSPGIKKEALYRAKYTKRIIKRLATYRTVLDVGCGDGTLVHLLNELFQPYNAFGIDIAPESIEVANEIGEKGTFSLGTINSLPVDKTFDLITVMEVLEHQRYPKEFLQSIKEHVHSNGYLLVGVPNLNGWGIGSRWKSSVRGMDYATDHAASYSPEGLIKLLGEMGFHIVSIHTHTCIVHIFRALGMTVIGWLEKLLKFTDNGMIVKDTKKYHKLIYGTVWACSPIFDLLYWPLERLTKKMNNGAQLTIVAKRTRRVLGYKLPRQ